MSDSRVGEEDEACSGEGEELIRRCSGNMHHDDDLDDSDDQIPRRRQQEKQGLSLDRRKGKNKKDRDKKGGSQGNRRKIQAKAKQLILSPVRRFEKHLEGRKDSATESTSRRSAAPFPYDGEDFGGSPSRFLCFMRPSNPLPSASPMRHIGTAASSETPGAVNGVKPKNSSYYYFLKTLIENNDFYSSECNVHHGMATSHAK